MRKEKKKAIILLVDDEANILDMYSHALAQVDYEILQAKDGRDAWDILASHQTKIIDLVLLDIIMPELDGFDVLRKIRKSKIYADVPVIMFTNLNRSEDIEEAKKYGAIDFFVKVKYTPADLIKKVNVILKKHEQA